MISPAGKRNQVIEVMLFSIPFQALAGQVSGNDLAADTSWDSPVSYRPLYQHRRTPQSGQRAYKSYFQRWEALAAKDEHGRCINRESSDGLLYLKVKVMLLA